jgi:hypothetical protein
MMFKKALLGRLIIVLSFIAIAVSNSMGQSVFRIGTFGFFHEQIPIWPIYFNQTANEWRVKGPERDRLLNIGFNYMLACTNLQADDALVFMGDSLDAAPVRKEFKSTVVNTPAVPPLFPQTYPMFRLSRNAQRYGIQSWNDSVTVGFQNMHNRHSARLDGVHSFLTVAEGCINQARMINGINFMCDNTIVDSYVQLGYVQTPYDCHSLTTYYMAKRLVRADHLATGNYVFQNATDTTGSSLQTALDNMIASYSDASRGIRDSTSIAKFWPIFQTQYSPDIPTQNPPSSLFRSPNRTELLCSVNLGLAYGAKGIIYYLWDPVTAVLDDSAEEYGLLSDSNHNLRQPTYDDVKTINTNYQGTGQSLVTIGNNFLNLTWKEGYSIHQNLTEPISSTYKLYDVTAKPPGGSNDAPNQTYVEVGVLQNAGNVNHYMVVNRRCTASETREVTITFQSTAGNAYRITDVFTSDSTTYYTATGTTFSHTITLGPGQGKLLKLPISVRVPARSRPIPPGLERMSSTSMLRSTTARR